MPSSSEVLRTRFLGDRIRVRDTQVFRDLPAPLGPAFDFGKVAGMMLGLAIGDALGNCMDSPEWYRVKAKHLDVRDFLQRPGYGSSSQGHVSDDSQMAFWTLEQYLKDGHFVPGAAQPVFDPRPRNRAFLPGFDQGVADGLILGPAAAPLVPGTSRVLMAG